MIEEILNESVSHVQEQLGKLPHPPTEEKRRATAEEIVKNSFKRFIVKEAMKEPVFDPLFGA